jgi:hypothetical protein
MILKYLIYCTELTGNTPGHQFLAYRLAFRPYQEITGAEAPQHFPFTRISVRVRSQPPVLRGSRGQTGPAAAQPVNTAGDPETQRRAEVLAGVDAAQPGPMLSLVPSMRGTAHAVRGVCAACLRGRFDLLRDVLADGRPAAFPSEDRPIAGSVRRPLPGHQRSLARRSLPVDC